MIKDIQILIPSRQDQMPFNYRICWVNDDMDHFLFPSGGDGFHSDYQTRNIYIRFTEDLKWFII